MSQEWYVIEIYYYGLGDHLFYTMLPRLLKERYPDKKVCIRYKGSRTLDIIKFIWELNPYVDKVIKSNLINNHKFEIKGIDIVSSINCAYGFKELNPKLECYYKTKLLSYYAESTVVDINYKSFVGVLSKSKILDIISDYKNLILINPPLWIIDAFPHSSVISNIDIETYADIINSCKNFICLTSGSASLADALGKASICLYGYGQSKRFHHSQIHKYVDVGLDSPIKFFCYLYLKVRNKLNA